MKKAVEVAAAFISKDGAFLICKRPLFKQHGGLWEFPGGKREPDESLSDTVIRECREELDITVALLKVMAKVTYDYPDITVSLSLFKAFIAEGEIKLKEHTDSRWITRDEIPLYDFCPADKKLLEIYEKTGI